MINSQKEMKVEFKIGNKRMYKIKEFSRILYINDAKRKLQIWR